MRRQQQAKHRIDSKHCALISMLYKHYQQQVCTVQSVEYGYITTRRHSHHQGHSIHLAEERWPNGSTPDCDALVSGSNPALSQLTALSDRMAQYYELA
jgi:hypothetical protein